ncbi:MAG: replication initiator protein [Microvirus sp.]|nr:MAG: replication initiator protein [Microvirus sp.]
MQCISPIWLSKTRGFVACGKCNFCLQRRRQDWSFRILEELRTATYADFVTFTYDEENVRLSDQGKLTLVKRDVQLAFKRIRKFQAHLPKNGLIRGSRLNDLGSGGIQVPPRLRYYTVGEYGTELGRPHYHSILFNLHPATKSRINELWGHGHVDQGTVTGKSIGYVTGYVINRPGDYTGREPPFAMISNRSGGLGKGYLERNYNWHKVAKRNFVQNGSMPGALPRYYSERIFNSHDRAKFHQENLKRLDQEYWSNVERVSAFHKNPELYLDEQIRYIHENIKNKCNENHQL